MKRRVIHWVNTPVLTEALVRYEKGQLPLSMKLWVEKLLEITPLGNCQSKPDSTIGSESANQ